MTNEEIKTHIQAILNSELIMSLATCDVDGAWASVVEFVADDAFNLYWLSAPQTRHSQSVLATHQAAATITLPYAKENPQGIGLQVCGSAQEVAESDFAQISDLMQKKRGKEIKPEMLAERRWYVLHPSTIYLIHEPLLGYQRVSYSI